MISFPPSKINLGLRVLAQRKDNYHDIETCFYPVPWTDALEIVRAPRFSFSLSGLSVPGDEDQNLCVKAYRLMEKAYQLPPVAIHLHKVIPSGAGLGGGSSDAAHTLRLLNHIFELKLAKEHLRRLATRLGSDCPFFIENGPMYATGRGDQLAPIDLDLSGMYVLIVKPDIHVSTAEAYRLVVPEIPEMPVKDIIRQPPATWRNQLMNDFQEPIADRYPVIAELVDAMYHAGSLLASMSGSGSSVFGLFDKMPSLLSGPHIQWRGRLSKQ